MTYTPGYSTDTTSVADIDGRFVAVHVLRPAVGVNLNSGLDGTPKTARVGGNTYMRVSSQAKKRAVREWMHTQISAEEQAVRTRRIPAAVADALTQLAGIDYDQALNTAIALLLAHPKSAGLKFTINAGRPEMTEEGVFSHRSTPEMLAQIASAHLDDLAEAAQAVDAFRVEDAKAKASKTRKGKHGAKIEGLPQLPKELGEQVKRAFSPGASAEIALSGRMLTAVPAGRIDGAVSVAHAITVDPMKVIADEWTWKDDWQAGTDDEPGAGGLNTLTLGSGVFYEWAVIDRAQLRANLAPAYGDDTDALDQACADAERMFVHGFAVAVPHAHSRATGANLAPSVVVTTVTDVPPTIVPFHYTPIVDDVVLTAAGRIAEVLKRSERRTPILGGLVEWGADVPADAVPAFPEALSVEV